MNFALKKGAGCEDGGVSIDVDSELGGYTTNGAFVDDQGRYHVLPEVDVGVGLQRGAPGLCKKVPVVLCSGGPHGGTF